MPLECLTFDAGNTLIYLPRSVGTHYAEVAHRHKIGGSPEEYDAAFRRQWKSLPRPEPRRQPAPDDHRNWWETLVRHITDEVHTPPLPTERFAPFFDDLYEHFRRPGVWQLLDPRTPEILKELSQAGLKLGIVSNFDKRLEDILKHLGIAQFFDVLTVSSQAGAEKPHPRIFQVTLQKLHCRTPQRALHIGDETTADIHGARKIGMQTWQIDPQAPSLQPLLSLINTPTRSS